MRWVVVAACAAGCGRIGFATIGPAGGDGGASGDGGVTGDGATADALMTTSSICPPTTAFSDDFNGTAIAATWTTTVGTNMTLGEASGALQIAFLSGTTPSGSRTGVTQATAIDYTESCAIAELDVVPDPSTMAWVDLTVGNSGAYVTFEEDAGSLYSLHKGGRLDVRPYDPVAHKFLRLRQHAGTWYWETSPDGTNYTTITSIASFVPLPTTVSLLSGCNTGAMNAGSAQFNSVVVQTP